MSANQEKIEIVDYLGLCRTTSPLQYSQLRKLRKNFFHIASKHFTIMNTFKSVELDTTNSNFALIMLIRYFGDSGINELTVKLTVYRNSK